MSSLRCLPEVIGSAGETTRSRARPPRGGNPLVSGPDLPPAEASELWSALDADEAWRREQIQDLEAAGLLGRWSAPSRTSPTPPPALVCDRRWALDLTVA